MEKKKYLIVLSDENGRFKTITKVSKKDEYAIKYDIEMQGDWYVEDIAIIE